MSIEVINDVLDNLRKAKSPNDVIESMFYLNMHGLDFSLQVVIEEYNRNVLSDQLNIKCRETNSDYIPFFSDSRMYFIDKETWNKMVQANGNNFVFEVDYSIMCDSNYATYIAKYLEGKLKDHLIISNIEFLLSGNYRFDYMIYILESYFNIFRNMPLSTDKKLSSKIDFYHNLYMLELFKNIDTDLFKKTKVITYKITETEAKLNVDLLFNDILNTNAAVLRFEVYEELYSFVQLYIIKILIIRYKSKKSPKNKMKELLKVMNEQIGVFFEREMMFAFDYFSSVNSFKIFDRVREQMSLDELSEIINNVTWDFSIPRIMEKFFKYGSEAKYYVPILLTKDKNMKKVFMNYQAKGVIFDQSKDDFTVFSDISLQGVFLSEQCNISIENYFSFDHKKMREKVYQMNKDNNLKVLDDGFKELCRLLKVTK